MLHLLSMSKKSGGESPTPIRLNLGLSTSSSKISMPISGDLSSREHHDLNSEGEVHHVSCVVGGDMWIITDFFASWRRISTAWFHFADMDV